jgi:hypothetical protein
MAENERLCAVLPLSVQRPQAHSPDMTIFVVLVLLAVLAPRYGADSRDGRDWQPRCPQW